MLPTKHPDIYQNFLKGHFTVRKSDKVLSCIGEDQAHEQNNKFVKIVGGAVDILESDESLLKWMVGGPEIARMVNEFEVSAESANHVVLPHHENSTSFEKRFRNHIQSFKKTFEEIGNPFAESANLMQVMTRIIVNESSVKSVANAKQIGNQQYKRYIEERITSCSMSI